VRKRTILVIEDGTEYIEAFRRLAVPDAVIELLPAANAAAARRLLTESRADALFLDVVFDRTPVEDLAGDLEELTARFSGDRAAALDHLARNQGFYVADALAPLLPPGALVLLTYDFSSEPARLAALREKLPGLEGITDGMAISEMMKKLAGERT
jgi:hypothetical protein